MNEYQSKKFLKNNEINPPDINTYLTKYEEALIFTKADMEGYYIFGVAHSYLANNIWFIVRELNSFKDDYNNNNYFIKRYKSFFWRVNKFEENGKTPEKLSLRGEVRISSLCVKWDTN